MPRRSITDRAYEAKIDEIAGLRLYLDTRARYGQTQWTEFWLSILMIAAGAVFLLPTETLSAPGYKVIASWIAAAHATENDLGSILVLSGLGRVWMIRKNGSAHYTPVFRAIGCLIGCAAWAGMGIGFLLAAPPIYLLTAFFPLFAVMELHSSMRAGADAIPQNSFGVRDFLVRRSERASRGKVLGGP